MHVSIALAIQYYEEEKLMLERPTAYKYPRGMAGSVRFQKYFVGMLPRFCLANSGTISPEGLAFTSPWSPRASAGWRCDVRFSRRHHESTKCLPQCPPSASESAATPVRAE